MGFRPLPGFLSSQCTDFKKWMYQTAWVSVPFRGFYLLNAAMNYILKVCNSFPSPSGVSIFSIRKRFNDNKNHFGFRPLPGFLSSQSGLAPLPCGARQVSVPFRGFYLLNASFRLLHNTCVRVSVPFRGFYLLNCMYVCMWGHLFPSPSGVSIFSIIKKFYGM